MSNTIYTQDTSEFVSCQICSKQLKRLDGSHLKIHNLSLAEYKLLYPDSETQSKEYKNKISIIGKANGERLRGSIRHESFGKLISEKKKGVPLSVLAKKNMSIARKASGNSVLQNEAAKKASAVANQRSKERALRELIEFLEVHNYKHIERTETGHTVQCLDCGEEFHRTFTFFSPKVREQKDGKFCPVCNATNHRGSWSLNSFENRPELKEVPGKLYLVEMKNEFERFLKIGITQGDMNNRYAKSHPYEISVHCWLELKFFEAFTREQKIISELSEFRYYPDIKFAGHTECLEYSELDTILEMIYSKSPSL